MKAGRPAGAGKREPGRRTRGWTLAARGRAESSGTPTSSPRGGARARRLQGRAHPGSGARTRTRLNMAAAATRSPEVSPAAPLGLCVSVFPFTAAGRREGPPVPVGLERRVRGRVSGGQCARSARRGGVGPGRCCPRECGRPRRVRVSCGCGRLPPASVASPPGLTSCRSAVPHWFQRVLLKDRFARTCQVSWPSRWGDPGLRPSAAGLWKGGCRRRGSRVTWPRCAR